MKYRNSKEKIYNELKNICMQMRCISIMSNASGILGLYIYHDTGKYIIHPVVYVFLIACGVTLMITAHCIERSNNKNYKPKEVKYCMTKAEAIVAMKNGQKVTHEYFSSNEYLFMEYGIIRTEEGYNFEEAWNERSGPEWQKGWRIYGTA